MKYNVEAFDKWHYICGQVHNYENIIRCRIDLCGRIDAEALKKAVTLSLITIPLIACVFESISKKPRWVEMGFTGENVVNLVEAESDAEYQIIRSLSSGLDVSAEPQLKITIVRGGGGDALCVALNHMLCDGVGCKQYLYILCKIYSNLLNGNEPPPQSYQQRGLKPLLAGISLSERIRLLRSDIDYNAPPDNHIQRGLDDNVGVIGTHILKRELPTDIFNALRVYVKAHKATVNDGLMALFARAFCMLTGTERIHIPSTMDLRKFIPPNIKYGPGNYSANCICSVAITPGDPLEKTIAGISRQMTTFKSDNGILKSILSWHYVTRFYSYRTIRDNFANKIKWPVFFYTNIGVIDAELLKFGSLHVKDAYMMSPIKPRPNLQFSASTFDGCCTLSCNIYGTESDRQFIGRIFDSIYAEAASL